MFLMQRISKTRGHVFVFIKECLSVLVDTTCDDCYDCDHCQPRSPVTRESWFLKLSHGIEAISHNSNPSMGDRVMAHTFLSIKMLFPVPAEKTTMPWICLNQIKQGFNTCSLLTCARSHLDNAENTGLWLILFWLQHLHKCIVSYCIVSYFHSPF